MQLKVNDVLGVVYIVHDQTVPEFCQKVSLVISLQSKNFRNMLLLNVVFLVTRPSLQSNSAAFPFPILVVKLYRLLLPPPGTIQNPVKSSLSLIILQSLPLSVDSTVLVSRGAKIHSSIFAIRFLQLFPRRRFLIICRRRLHAVYPGLAARYRFQ